MSNMDIKADILNWVETVDKGDENEITTQCSLLAECVKNGTVNLLDTVVAAERLLTAPDTGTRSAVVSAFAKLIHYSGDTLDATKIAVFNDFFTAKLLDHFSLIPGALQGLLALSQSKNLPDGQSRQILTVLFREVNCQSMLQPERRNFYLIIRNLLERKTQELQAMGTDLVLGLVQAMDSERDPRNLLLLFRFLPAFFKLVDPGPLDEEVFEVVSAYFPIEFSPPANDPQGVTREALSESLRLTLAASPRLAQHCLPFLLEKLEATQVSSRTESFLTLECCCTTYSAAQVNPFMDAFWTAIRKELFLALSMGPDREKAERAALDFLAALMRLVAAQGPLEVPVKRILDRIIEDCKSHLKQPEHRLVFPSTQILSALTASAVAATLVFEKVVPLLAELCMTHTLASQRATLLEVLQRLLRACRECDNEQVTRTFVPKLLDLLSHFPNEEDPSLKSQLWLNYAVLVGVLPEPDLQKLCQNLRLAIVEEKRDNVREALKVTLRNLDAFNPSLVATQIASPLAHSAQSDSLWILDTLSATEELMDNVWEPLGAKLTPENSPEVLQCLATLSRNSRQYMSVFTERDRSSLIQKSVQRCLELHTWVIRNASNDLIMVKNVAAVLRNLAGIWTPEICKEYGEQFAAYYIQGTQYAVFPQSTGALLDQRPVLVLVLESILGWFVTLELELEPLVKKLVGITSISAEEDIQASCGRLIAALINKIATEDELERILKCIDDCLRPTEFRAHAYTYIWVTKALAMRGFLDLKKCLQKLCDSLNIWTSDISTDWALLFKEEEASLCPSSHACVKLLYRQRLFSLMVPLLISAFQNASEDQKSVYLAALACQLPYVSKAILLPHLPKLVPVLLESLARPQESPELLTSTLSALSDLLKESPTVLTDAGSSLVTRLLNLAQKSNFWRVRRDALTCINLMSNLPSVVLLPLRTEVILSFCYSNKANIAVSKSLRGIVPCLDDKKRLVRQEAAKTRNRWFLIGQPGGVS